MGKPFVMRMADRLQRIEPTPYYPAEQAMPIARFANSHTRFIADGIQDIVGNKSGIWNCGDFPCPVPPYDFMWIEWLAGPDCFAGSGIEKYKPGTKWVHYGGNKPPSEAVSEVFGTSVMAHKDGGRWHGRLIGIYGFYLDKDGEQLGFGFKITKELSDSPTPPSVLAASAVPAMCFLSFVNCRGVSVVDSSGPSPGVAKSIRDKTGKPLLSYKTVNIGLTIPKSNSGISQQALNQTLRMHMVRGHIKHYTADKPMFGRYVGNVFCPQHVRGDDSNGMVVKDYRVKV